MAQHDYSIANQGFPAFRADLNDALAGLVSNSSGATEPSTIYAHQFWVDTSADPSVLKQRNADNDAWITIASIDQTGDTFNLAVAQGGTGAATAAAAKIALEVITATTGSAVVPAGTEAQRDGSPAAGYFRFNSDTGAFEGYNGTAWGAVGGGATGAGGDAVFVENDQTVTTDYTITSGKNASSAGPIEIDTGVTVTIPTDSVWTIV